MSKAKDLADFRSLLNRLETEGKEGTASDVLLDIIAPEESPFATRMIIQEIINIIDDGNPEFVGMVPENLRHFFSNYTMFSEFKISKAKELINLLEEGQEPWEMTQDEYNDMMTDQRSKVAPDYVEGGEYYRDTYVNDSQWEGSRYNKVKELENPDAYVATWGKTYYDTILKAEQWMKEHPEYLNVGERHGKLVKQAVDQGKPVPPEVLIDYPELKRK